MSEELRQANRGDETNEGLKSLLEADAKALDRLGIKIVSVGDQKAVLTLTVEDTMTNSHDICHGGFLFALADTAFAYVLAMDGQPPATLQASIAFTSAARLGETVTATANISRAGRKAGFAEVRVSGADGRTIASFQGAGLLKG